MKVECCICLEDFSADGDGKIQALKCGHLFHENCINAWLKNNESCPQCREAVKRDELYFIHLTSTVNSSRRSSIFNSSVCQEYREVNENLLTVQERYRNDILELTQRIEQLVDEKQKLLDEKKKLVDEKQRLVDREKRLKEERQRLLEEKQILLDEKQKLVLEYNKLKKESVADRIKRLVAENEMLKKDISSEVDPQEPKLINLKNAQSTVARAWKK